MGRDLIAVRTNITMFMNMRSRFNICEIHRTASLQMDACRHRNQKKSVQMFGYAMTFYLTRGSLFKYSEHAFFNFKSETFPYELFGELNEVYV